jgi:hypothetical protein
MQTKNNVIPLPITVTPRLQSRQTLPTIPPLTKTHPIRVGHDTKTASCADFSLRQLKHLKIV